MKRTSFSKTIEYRNKRLQKDHTIGVSEQPSKKILPKTVLLMSLLYIIAGLFGIYEIITNGSITLQIVNNYPFLSFGIVVNFFICLFILMFGFGILVGDNIIRHILLFVLYIILFLLIFSVMFGVTNTSVDGMTSEYSSNNLFEKIKVLLLGSSFIIIQVFILKRDKAKQYFQVY